MQIYNPNLFHLQMFLPFLSLKIEKPRLLLSVSFFRLKKLKQMEIIETIGGETIRGGDSINTIVYKYCDFRGMFLKNRPVVLLLLFLELCNHDLYPAFI